MNTKKITVSSTEALLAASKDPSVRIINVNGALTGVPPVRLAAGQQLQGTDETASISFTGDGIQLSTDNTVQGIRLAAPAQKRAIFNDTSVDSLGRIAMHNVTTTGYVQILARDKVRSGHVEVRVLKILSADARAEAERPHGYGVYVLQGAFTLWNMQKDEAVTITADLAGLAVGRPDAPVRGSGIFVSGAGDVGGKLQVERLDTEAVYSDGGIVPGTPDQISGGIFIVYGAHATVVRNLGPVVTYGPNDMVLDNWGAVDRWIAEGKITSHGPSGIGFVNFGTLGELKVEAPIETFGKGARGFNVYTGTVKLAEFDRVVTHGDGAVGIQISQPIGKLLVRRGIETFGGTGDSLVKGVVMKLSAIALSVKPGGSAIAIEIAGGVKTNGMGISPIEQHGNIESLKITGGFSGMAGGFDKI